MNSSTTKKVTAIYRANSFLFFFLFLKVAVAQDLHSYCFERSVNLSEVQQSLGMLLLSKDIVDKRIEDNCIDIITSPDRGKLFEKFLSRRYDFRQDSRDESLRESPKPSECRLDFRTTKNAKTQTGSLKIGEKNLLSSGSAINSSVSNLEMLLGEGIPGEFEAGAEKLKVSCQLIGTEKASLVFSYSERDKASASTQVLIKRGEWLNVASVKKDLADKSTTLGIPQSEIGQSEEKIETIYELQLK